MKQIKFFYTLVLISSIAYAQEIPTLNFEQTNNIDFYLKIKNNTSIGEYIASDGNTFKVGDEITLGAPRKSSGFEDGFEYIQLGKFGGAMGALMSAGNVETPMVPENFEGRRAKISEIRTYHKGNKKKPLYVVLELTEPNGNSFVALTKRISVNETELALKYGEIIPMNAKMSRDAAIKKLKEAKELLELDMMSQEEYDNLKNELAPIIKGN
jgi:hypothetical protein